MIAVADAIKNGIITRDLTDDERWAIEDVLVAAEHWKAGRLPIWQFTEVGKLPAWNSQGRRVESAGYGRALALMATPQADPRWSCLRDAVEASVRQQDVTFTRQGMFDRDELDGTGAVVR